jgi:spoIIIJ-associated protein
MYDRSNEANEFMGDSVEEATGNAARFYGVEAAELKIVVPGPGEIAGAGARAVVVAVPKSLKRSPARGGGGDRGRGERRETRERKSEGERGQDRGRERPEREPEPAPPTSESKGTASGDMGEMGDFLLGVVERMGLGSFTIGESTEDDFLVYQLRGDAAEGLRSGDGRAIDALQLVANQAAKQAFEDPPRIVVDVEGDADDREDSLTKLADRAADRAIDSGRSVALDPMNPRDRRIVHVALRDRDQIATMSIGSGRYRQVVVVPEGASEYEEASSASGGSDS